VEYVCDKTTNEVVDDPYLAAAQRLWQDRLVIDQQRRGDVRVHRHRKDVIQSWTDRVAAATVLR
jgi:hypothetical protein